MLLFHRELKGFQKGPILFQSEDKNLKPPHLKTNHLQMLTSPFQKKNLQYRNQKRNAMWWLATFCVWWIPSVVSWPSECIIGGIFNSIPNAENCSFIKIPLSVRTYINMLLKHQRIHLVSKVLCLRLSQSINIRFPLESHPTIPFNVVWLLYSL